MCIRDRDTKKVYIGFMYATIMLYGDTFQSLPFSNISPMLWSYNPNYAVTQLVWANPRSLATTYGIIQLFSSPTGTKMFQFPAFASIQDGQYPVSYTHLTLPTICSVQISVVAVSLKKKKKKKR
eukprot:TRINITY_DN4698_c0_g1_i5.p2 TRINITY_DN4698_c0_g1~~TRINITY_DN4698_c0_g1_i5.p2  ORF type:complete len:124 (+),score=18.71 TRINITY_DN4698_c0_g1_i5:142-513(+)